MKTAFIVQSLGYWGHGATVKQAAEQCLKAGASKGDKTVVDFFVGDDKPTIAHDGMTIQYLAGTQQYHIGSGFSLGSLLRLKE